VLGTFHAALQRASLMCKKSRDSYNDDWVRDLADQ
jgi:hypothetical protein